MECTVKQRGKFFIVVDPFNQNSYTLNNKLEAERLCEALNEAVYFKGEVCRYINKHSIFSREYERLHDVKTDLIKSCKELEESLEVLYNASLGADDEGNV